MDFIWNGPYGIHGIDMEHSGECKVQRMRLRVGVQISPSSSTYKWDIGSHCQGGQ